MILVVSLQVYKMIVEWTSGTTSIVYRRYSMFFDFQVSTRCKLPIVSFSSVSIRVSMDWI